jgi:nitrogen-specific signal transduction histidine kinase
MFEFWCEYDINPLIIFNQKGNIVYCNQEAEIFLSYINKKEVFDFTLKNAPKEAGIKTEFKKISFKDFEFNGFSIGYENDSQIGVRFFINTDVHSIHLEELEKVDLSMIINFAIEYINLKQSTKFNIYFDPSIPEIYLNKKAFLNLLFEIFEELKEAYIETKVNIGEYIKVNQKKYPIISVIVKTIPKPTKNFKSSYFEIINNEEGYIIQIPLIKEKNENNNS